MTRKNKRNMKGRTGKRKRTGIGRMPRKAGRAGQSRLKPYEAEIPENAAAIADQTFRTKSQMWMNNMAENMATIRNGRDIEKLPKAKGTALVVGAGPSVRAENHLQKLREAEWDGYLLCTDKMLIPCLRAGVLPDVVLTVDGDPYIAKYYDDPLVDRYRDDVKAVFDALTVHPKVVERVPFEKYWFLTFVDDPLDPKNPKSLTRTLHFMVHKTIIQSGGNVGASAWHLGYYLQADPVGMIGLDYSYPADTPIEKTIYYDAFVKICKGDMSKVKRCYRTVTNPDTGREVLVDLMWDSYASVFFTYAEKARCRTINCSPTSLLFGHGIGHMPLEEFMERFKASG